MRSTHTPNLNWSEHGDNNDRLFYIICNSYSNRLELPLWLICLPATTSVGRVDPPLTSIYSLYKPPHSLNCHIYLWTFFPFFSLTYIFPIISQRFRIAAPSVPPWNMEPNTNFVQPRIDENGWVIQIKETLDILQGEEEDEFCASVFNVPKELLALKPEAYIPQSVSIGPYHHKRSELYEMERYKLAAVNRFLKRMNKRGKFQFVVLENFKQYDWKIRSCYHKCIDYEKETLAWLFWEEGRGVDGRRILH